MSSRSAPRPARRARLVGRGAALRERPLEDPAVHGERASRRQALAQPHGFGGAEQHACAIEIARDCGHRGHPLEPEGEALLMPERDGDAQLLGEPPPCTVGIVDEETRPAEVIERDRLAEAVVIAARDLEAPVEEFERVGHASATHRRASQHDPDHGAPEGISDLVDQLEALRDGQFGGIQVGGRFGHLGDRERDRGEALAESVALRAEVRDAFGEGRDHSVVGRFTEADGVDAEQRDDPGAVIELVAFGEEAGHPPADLSELAAHPPEPVQAPRQPGHLGVLPSREEMIDRGAQLIPLIGEPRPSARPVPSRPTARRPRPARRRTGHAVPPSRRGRRAARAARARTRERWRAS